MEKVICSPGQGPVRDTPVRRFRGMTVAFAKYVLCVLCFTYVVLLSFYNTQSWEGCLIIAI